MKHHNIIQTLFHYTRTVYSTVLMALDLLVAQQNKETDHTTGHLTPLLYYCTTHSESEIE